MTMICAIDGRSDARVESLLAEFGPILAARIMESEAAEFLWDGRVKERYLGQHFDVGFCSEEDEIELSRVAILSVLAGKWHAGICLIDGEGNVVDLLWKQGFESRAEAEAEYDRAA